MELFLPRSSWWTEQFYPVEEGLSISTSSDDTTDTRTFADGGLSAALPTLNTSPESMDIDHEVYRLLRCSPFSTKSDAGLSGCDLLVCRPLWGPRLPGTVKLPGGQRVHPSVANLRAVNNSFS
eukprot:SAG31_NODE_17919_length_653_cov_1.211191_2_plen_122_part_01